MNISMVNPYIRLTAKSKPNPPCTINSRVLFDCDLLNVAGEDFFLRSHIHFDMFCDKYTESRYICYKQLSEMTEYETQMIHENIFADTPPALGNQSGSLYIREIVFRDHSPLRRESRRTNTCMQSQNV